MAYRLIACDLDETLLSTDRTVCEKNRKAIEEAAEKGVKFVCATGRGYASIRPTLEEIDLYQKPEEYSISFNGGAVTENEGNRVLNLNTLDFEKAKELFERGLDYDVCIHVYTKEDVWFWNINDNERAYVDGRMEIKLLDQPDIDFLQGEDILKVLYCNTDYSYLKSIEEDLKEISGDLDVSYSSNRYIEFNPKGVSKGSALLWLADYLGIPHEETIAIGDNFNDLSMIQAAGKGIGVANTIEDMKLLCDELTSSTNNEGAVAEVIEKYVLDAE